jgi:hypothetical protein
MPGANRTRNLQLRRLLLYPIELRAQEIFFGRKIQKQAFEGKAFRSFPPLLGLLFIGESF